MLTALFFLNFILMITLPLAAGSWLAQRYRLGWGVFGIGAATFVLSQVGHLPFNWLILQRLRLLPGDLSQWGDLLIYGLFLGLSAGVFEEVARYLVYRFWAKDARSWREGMMMGAGHGGMEALLIGLIGLLNFSVMLGMSRGMLLNAVPPEMMASVEAQIEQVFTTPLWLVPLGFIERIFAMLFHLAASLLVLQVFVRGQKRWLLAAVLLHTVFNATAVVVLVRTNAIVTEGALALLTIISVAIIVWLRRVEPVPEPAPAPAPVPTWDVEQIKPTQGSLDDSRFTGGDT